MKTNTLTQGSIFKALFSFSLPIIITNTISILFHAADVAVLAFLVDGPAVAAVGACGSLITLMVSLFTGLATGANVLISKRVGANDETGTKRAIGTSLTVGLLSGIFLTVTALLFARRFLIWMNCQPDVLDMATLYMKIYFLGSPIMMLNSFSVAVLRSAATVYAPCCTPSFRVSQMFWLISSSLWCSTSRWKASQSLRCSPLCSLCFSPQKDCSEAAAFAVCRAKICACTKTSLWN